LNPFWKRERQIDSVGWGWGRILDRLVLGQQTPARGTAGPNRGRSGANVYLRGSVSPRAYPGKVGANGRTSIVSPVT
jgi:hypothetical protein